MENRNDTYAKKEFRREDAYFRAEKRLKELKGFYWHLFWYVIISTFTLISSIVVDAPYFNLNHFNAYSTFVFWGIGIAIHAIAVFGKHLVFSKKWEERKIREYMKKEENDFS